MIAQMILLAALSNGPVCCRAMAGLTLDPAFRALHAAPCQIEFIPKYGHMAKVAGMQAFVVPAKRGARGGIVMIHEWWGLNNQIKSTAEKLHEATGGGVVAVDLYEGKVATTPDLAGQYVRQVQESSAVRELRDTIDEILTKHILGSSVDRVGTIGYCFGGGWSLRTAIEGGDKVAACVMYYGHPETDPASIAKLRAPVLGIFGNLDRGITPKMVDQFVEDMKAANKSLEVHRYEAVHGFANPSNPKFDPVATADAWSHAVAFFNRYVMRKP